MPSDECQEQGQVWQQTGAGGFHSITLPRVSSLRCDNILGKTPMVAAAGASVLFSTTGSCDHAAKSNSSLSPYSTPPPLLSRPCSSKFVERSSHCCADVGGWMCNGTLGALLGGSLDETTRCSVADEQTSEEQKTAGGCCLLVSCGKFVHFWPGWQQ